MLSRFSRPERRIIVLFGSIWIAAILFVVLRALF